MDKGKGLFMYLIAVGLVILLGSCLGFAEDTAAGNTVEQSAAAAPAAAPAPEVTAAPAAEETAVPVEETRWLWAEVIAVDAANKQFTVKYLSYDSDEEKEMGLSVTDATKLENFSSLAEMAAGDNVSVDYVMDASGKATAKSVSLQKAKPAATAPEAATSTAVTTATPVVEAVVTTEAAPAKEIPAKTLEAANPPVEPAATPAAEPAAPVTEQK